MGSSTTPRVEGRVRNKRPHTRLERWAGFQGGFREVSGHQTLMTGTTLFPYHSGSTVSVCRQSQSRSYSRVSRPAPVTTGPTTSRWQLDPRLSFPTRPQYVGPDRGRGETQCLDGHTGPGPTPRPLTRTWRTRGTLGTRASTPHPVVAADARMAGGPGPPVTTGL